MTRETIVNGKKVSCIRVSNDVYGNPRYVVSWLDIGNFDNYEEALKVAKRVVSARKYRGKDFGGGIIITSYNLERDLERLDNASRGCVECIDCNNCIDCKYCTECRGCVECIDCNSCIDCKYCTGCYRCSECRGCVECYSCTECRDCTDCYGCTDCIDCSECNSCTECRDCTDCSFCYGCSNLFGKKYHINNKDYGSFQTYKRELNRLGVLK